MLERRFHMDQDGAQSSGMISIRENIKLHSQALQVNPRRYQYTRAASPSAPRPDTGTTVRLLWRLIVGRMKPLHGAGGGYVKSVGN